jgi:hypothetical protein
MPRYKVPVSYQMTGLLAVTADSIEDAVEFAQNDTNPGLDDLEDPTYVDGSWEALGDPDGIEEVDEAEDLKKLLLKIAELKRKPNETDSTLLKRVQNWAGEALGR